MAKKTSQIASKTTQLGQTLAELHIEFLRQFAPRSTEHLINSAVELMEAHRELIAERIARLERARARLATKKRAAAGRKISVRKGRSARAKTIGA
jgi:hypothetical protein